MTTNQYRKAKERRRAGYTFAGVAKELGLSVDELRVEMRRHQTSERHQQRRAESTQRRRRRFDRDATIAMLLTAGRSARDVAQVFGITAKHARAIRKKASK